MTPEGKTKRLVKAMLDKFGSECWRFAPVQTGFGSVAHDFILCFRGNFVSIETKREGKDLTPLQKGTRRSMWDAGGIVLRISNHEELHKALDILTDLEWIHGRPEEIPGYIATAQAQGEDQQHPSAEQPAQAPDRAAGRDHGAPRKKSARHPQPAARGNDPAVTAAVTYQCPSCGDIVEHPAVLRSIPWCASPGCDVPMKRKL